ncbi:unnamed protein product [Diamesa serratosioi]
MSSSRKVFAIFVIVLVVVILMVDAARDGSDVYKQRKHHQKVRKNHRKPEVKKVERQEQQNFHEVDAFGDDFIDFGAQTGPKGQFSWHADFPLE